MPIAIRLSSQSKVPKYRQIFEAVRQAILSGALKPGEKLPSSRVVADRLGISRDSVSRSYLDLASQGYLHIAPSSGVMVNPHYLPPSAKSGGPSDVQESARQRQPRLETLSGFGRRVAQAEELSRPAAYLLPELNFDAPMLDELPVLRWKDALKKSARLQDPSLLAYINDPLGFRPLREAIAAYLARSRFITCSPDQIAIFTTTEGGTDLICRLLLEAGDHVAVENPGSPAVRLTFRTHGANMHAIRVDDHGLVVEELTSLAAPLKLIYVTPSHHDPTGCVMSEKRRLDLLQWATKSNAYIIEDDFDSEYRYGDKPVPAMKGLDSADCVIYRYNFWRVLFPLARLAFMVLPKHLVSLVRKARELTERDVPIVEQNALAEFISEGHLEVHIRRTRALYAKRRAALVQALTKHLGRQLRISPASGGMHIIVRFQNSISNRLVLEAARRSNLPLVSLVDRYVDAAPTGECMIAFAHRDEHEFEPIVSRFAGELLK